MAEIVSNGTSARSIFDAALCRNNLTPQMRPSNEMSAIVNTRLMTA
jgi:hypothetical protein